MLVCVQEQTKVFSFVHFDGVKPQTHWNTNHAIRNVFFINLKMTEANHNPLYTNGFLPSLARYNRFWDGYNFQIIRNFCVILANSVDTYEMPHNAVFHMGVHCLP